MRAILANWLSRPIVWLGVAAALLLTLAYGFYWRPRAALLNEIGQLKDDASWYEKNIDARTSSVARLNAQSARMLGNTPNLVDARFRTALNTIADASGLGAIRVSSREPRAHSNPVGDAKLSGTLDSTLKKQIDFYSIEGELTAVGTYEQALRTIAMIQAQPWAHRTTSVSLRPEGDKERQRFELRLSVVTIFAPDLVAKNSPEPSRGLIDQATEALLAGIVQKDVFRESKPQVAQKPPTPDPAPPGPPPPPPPKDPYADWRLTAVVGAGERQEAWLVNKETGQRLTLAAGGQVEGAVLVSAIGERAVFTVEGKRYEVKMGNAMDTRRALE